METMIFAFGASTLALVLLPLVDYLLDEETVIKRKMLIPHAW
jgi:hypothetical protein